MKHYLLTFNQDHGDEFDVSAQAVMNEKEYNSWLNSPSGELNENYEDEIAIYKVKEDAYRKFWSDLEIKGLLRKARKDFTTEEIIWYDENKVEPPEYGTKPRPVNSSYMHASLGNYGDYFSDDYREYRYMKDMVKANIVNVQGCSESFYHEFNKLSLSAIGLVNVFSMEEHYIDEDDE